MASENDLVLDLSTNPCRRSPDIQEPYVKVEPCSPDDLSSESDSGLDIVDSARNSTDERPPLSPSTSIPSNTALSPKEELQESQNGLPPMPPMLMMPQPPGLTIPGRDGEESPFKMSYPYDAMSMMMNPLTMAAGMSDVDSPFPGSVTQLISQRRRRTGEKRPATSDSSSDNQLPPKKAQGTPVPLDKKDESYWERRRRNNDAAKRSRDMRRRKEEEIAMRAAFLEQENLKLRAQVAILKNETAKLHYLLYNRV